MKPPWNHLRKPNDDELTDSIDANKLALLKARNIIKQHLEQDGELLPVNGDNVTCSTHDDTPIAAAEEEVVAQAKKEPDFYPPHLPKQYHQTGWFGRLIALFGIGGSNGHG